jgi:hypothetical protein
MRTIPRVLPVVALAAIAVAAAPNGAGDDQRDAILKVMERGRDALLAGKGRKACSLLTRHGRRQALRFGVADFRENPPRTCRGVLRREYREEHDPELDPTWSEELLRSRFTVTRVKDGRATVRLKILEAYGPTVTFQLRKTAHGWRIHDSDAVPYGD